MRPWILLACLAPATAAAAAPLAPPAAIAKPTYDPSRSLAPLVEAVDDAVVTIKVESMAEIPEHVRRMFGVDGTLIPRTGEGSGFVVSADGLVFTNHHVIAGATEIRVIQPDGREWVATVLGSDEAMDVALLRLADAEGLPYLELGDSVGLRVGDWVVAMGNGLGLGTTVTTGIVSGKGRVLGHDLFGRESFVQTDAAINQGNSGGPLFDLDGRVVGMSTAIVAGANNVGFAIPSNLLAEVLDDLRDNGRVARGYLGVAPQTLDAELREALGVKAATGAVLTRVEAGTPAATAGLVTGDVVLSIDGEPIETGVELVRSVAAHRPGDSVSMVIERGRKAQTLAVVLAERPGAGPALADPNLVPPAVSLNLGLTLAPLSPALAAEAGVRAGVLVERVERASATEGRIQPGDILLEVNRRPVETPADVDRLLARTSGTAFVLVLRDEAQQFVALPLP